MTRPNPSTGPEWVRSVERRLAKVEEGGAAWVGGWLLSTNDRDRLQATNPNTGSVLALDPADVDDAAPDSTLRGFVTKAQSEAGDAAAKHDVLAELWKAITGQDVPEDNSLIGQILQGKVDGLPTLATIQNQIADILAGNAVTPINSAVQAVKDWFFANAGKTSGLTNLGQLDVSKLLGLLGQDRVVGLPDALTALTQIGQVFGGQLVTPINSAVQTVKDWFFANTGKTAGLAPNGNLADAFVPGLGSFISGIFRALTGNTNPTATKDQAAAQLAELAATTAANASAIAALQASEDGASNSGMNGGDEFTYVNATGLGDNWSTAYNTGTDADNGFYSVDGAQMVWQDRGSSARTSRHRRILPADMTTLTDYQKIALVQGTVTGEDPSSIRLYGRMNAAETQYVYAEIGTTKALLGYTLNGFAGETQFPTDVGSSSADTTQAVGVSWTLECGALGGLRIFRISRNSTPILTYTDQGGLSAAGPSNRGWGVGGGATNRFFGQGTPSTITRSTVADNLPPTYVGSGITVYRASTTPVSKDASESVQPPRFFDTLETKTADYVWDPVSQTVYVRDAGWYMAVIAIRVSGGTNNATGQCAVAYVGTAAAPAGVVVKRGFPIQTGGSGGVSQGYYLQCPLYITAGGTFRPGSTGSGNMPSQTGSADGANTYFSLVKLNR